MKRTKTARATKAPMNTFAEKLNILIRHKDGGDLSKLGEAMNVRNGTIMKFLHYGKRPGQRLLRKIAAYFGLPVAKLTDDAQELLIDGKSIAQAEHERQVEIQMERFGRTLDVPVQVGMVIRDLAGELDGIVFHSFETLDLIVYMGQDGKLHSCRPADVTISPRPDKSFYMPVGLFSREDLALHHFDQHLRQVHRVIIQTGRLMKMVEALDLPDDRDLQEYPRKINLVIEQALSDLHELVSNLSDHLVVGEQNTPQEDGPPELNKAQSAA